MNRFMRPIPFSLLALLVLSITSPCIPASAAIYYDNTYVNAATGSDEYSGTSPTYLGSGIGPTKTIGASIGRTISNGTVHVAAGTYTELVRLSENMNLVGESALTTIINANGLGCAVTVSSAPYQTNIISGFTIKGGAPYNGSPGGGIYISSSHIVTINDCAIVDNNKGAGLSYKGYIGGGVCNDNGQVYMNRCTVSGNRAVELGGGIANLCTSPGTDFGKMWLTNCTISSNTVTDSQATGGGLYNDSNADVTLLNVTIAGNSATGGKSAGGGFSNNSLSSMYFKNCIVAGNTAGYPEWNNGYNGLGTGVNSQGHNLSSDNSCFFTGPADQVNTNPLLGPLQNNGGPTSTHAITAGSPAYNRGTSVGDPPETDQRGIIRPQAGGYDIGAFELVSAPTIISVNPAQATQGQALTITIAGTNLTGAIAVNFSGTGITANTPTIISDTQITVNIDIAAGATTGWRNISVTTPGGTGTLLNGFTVLALQHFIGTGSPGGSSGSVPSSFTTTPPVINPSFTVQSASLIQPRISDTPVTVNAAVSNTSTVSGIARVRLYVNGKIDAEKVVSIPPGGRSQVSFTVNRTEPGTYQVYVNDVPAGSFRVEAVRNNDLVLYISLAMVAVSLILGMVYVVRRRSI